MSSPVFPTLNLDVGGRRADRWLAIAVLITTPVALTLLKQPLAVAIALMAGATVALAAGFRLAGWLGGPRRIVRIVCQSDGHWVLSDAADRVSECALSGASRVTPFAVWLWWQGRSQPLFLLPGDLPTADFRRLVVRLRLADRLIPGGSSEQ